MHVASPSPVRACAGQNNLTIFATIVSVTGSPSPAINGTVAVRARSTSDRANNLPGTLLGTVVIGTCSQPSYTNAPPNGCFGTIPLPGTLSADTYTFVGQYSGARPRHACLLLHARGRRVDVASGSALTLTLTAPRP